MMRKLYIDIDGVLLSRTDPRPAEYAVEFIDYITTHFDCYWLTTHCKGEAVTVSDYLSEYFPDDIIAKMMCVKPTMWETLKTEAIDFESDFYWLDDYPFKAELAELEWLRLADRCIVVNLNRKDELKRIMFLLEEKIG